MPQGSRSSRPLSEKFLRKSVLFSFIVKRISLPPRGKEILDNFSEFLPKFKKVLPYDYDRMLRVIASVEERGLDGEQAQIEAFYTVQKKK